MLIACGNRGFGLSQVRAWDHAPASGELRVWVGAPDDGAGVDPIVFHDEEAAEVLLQLRRHAAAARSTLDAIEDLNRALAAGPVE